MHLKTVYRVVHVPEIFAIEGLKDIPLYRFVVQNMYFYKNKNTLYADDVRFLSSKNKLYNMRSNFIR